VIVRVTVFVRPRTLYVAVTLHFAAFFGATSDPLLTLQPPLTRHVGFTFPSFNSFVSEVRDPRTTVIPVAAGGAVGVGTFVVGGTAGSEVAGGVTGGVTGGSTTGGVLGKLPLVVPLIAGAAFCVPAGPTATSVTE
jgi:hypothetical protein